MGNNKLLRNSLLSLIAAIILFVLFILPAEFGLDPTGLGRVIGLNQLQAPNTEIIEIRDFLSGNETYKQVEIPAYSRDPIPLPNPNVHQEKDALSSEQTVTITLNVDEETEIKLMIDEGQMVIYDWHVDQGTIYSDFHGHEPEVGDVYWVRYQEHQEGTDQASGSLVAPFSGEHGWYWLNYNDFPVTITLKVNGFYNELIDHGIL